MSEMRDRWAGVVRDGVCTMDPDVAHWVRRMMGIADIPYFIPMRLADMVAGLCPGAKDLLAEQHRAGKDATMHWKLCRELTRRARSERARPLTT